MSLRWMEVAERGSVAGVRGLLAVIRLFGRRAARFIVRGVIFYYTLVHRTARRASRDYLKRMGLRASFRDVYRHLLSFGHCTLDRLFFVQGRHDLFEIRTHGDQLLADLRNRQQGAILLGAHLGSFEAMRMQGDVEDLRINVLGYFRNAAMINQVLTSLNPQSQVRVVELEPGRMDFVLRIKELVEDGQMVAMLGDRLAPDGRGVSVDFLGGTAVFPTGPYMLAAVLRCPVYLTFGIYRGDNRYDLYCERFASAIELPRNDRDNALRQYAQRFAERLEAYTRDAPRNWFNFYDFWEERGPEQRSKEPG